MSGKGSDKSSRKAKKTDEFASSSDDDYVEDEEQEAEKDWPSMHQPEGWLLETGHFSDVTVSCGPRTYKLHKAVLARESIFFRDKFLDPNEDEHAQSISGA